MTLSRAPVRSGAGPPKGGRPLLGTGRRALCRMIKRPSPGKARDVPAACRRRREGNGMWTVARGPVRPYPAIRGRPVRMARPGRKA